MRRLARWAFVVFVFSTLGGQAAAQASADPGPGALERTWAVWAEVDWSAPWAKHHTSPEEALDLLGSLGGRVSRLILYGPDPRSAFDLAGWLADNGHRVVRVASATGETVLMVALATGETVVIVVRAARDASVIVVRAAEGALLLVAEVAGGALEPLRRQMQGIDAPKALDRLLTAPGWVRRLWID